LNSLKCSAILDTFGNWMFCFSPVPVELRY
jgi:hypothetical protein